MWTVGWSAIWPKNTSDRAFMAHFYLYHLIWFPKNFMHLDCNKQYRTEVVLSSRLKYTSLQSWSLPITPSLLLPSIFWLLWKVVVGSCFPRKGHGPSLRVRSGRNFFPGKVLMGKRSLCYGWWISQVIWELRGGHREVFVGGFFPLHCRWKKLYVYIYTSTYRHIHISICIHSALTSS